MENSLLTAYLAGYFIHRLRKFHMNTLEIYEHRCPRTFILRELMTGQSAAGLWVVDPWVGDLSEVGQLAVDP
jgi:hypothetical protein